METKTDKNHTRLDIFDCNTKKVEDSISVPIEITKQVNHDLIYKVIRVLMNNMKRIRSSHYKNESGLSGSTAKLRRQKGFGKARIGSRKALHLVGGAVKFGFLGDKYQDYHRRYKSFLKVNKIENRKSIIEILKNKINNNLLFICKNLFEFKKTKDLNSYILNNKLFTNVNYSIVHNNDSFIKPYRNIHNIKLININAINAYDLIVKDKIIFDYDCFKTLCKNIFSLKNNTRNIC